MTFDRRLVNFTGAVVQGLYCASHTKCDEKDLAWNHGK